MKLVRLLDSRGKTQLAALRDDGTAEELAGDSFGPFRRTGRTIQGRRLAPVAPTAILGVGLNYRRHAAESGAPVPAHPVLFAKGLNTLQHPGAPILIPTRLPSTQVDYECELAVVIGRACRNAARAQALDHVLGYTCANDVSARDWQLEKDKGGGQWCRGKFFDTFCPLGPCLVTPEDLPNPNALGIRTRLNGAIVQDWRTDDMIFDVPTLIEFLSASTTLLPGTVILTGTPHGVGMAAKPPRWLKPGDTVEIEIDGIGCLSNPVALEP
jgi:2-keto-4-pentenoate hydratase/2-oxohepta-3-ene-1,7-dioic acid hydratase in catechol pathway